VERTYNEAIITIVLFHERAEFIIPIIETKFSPRSTFLLGVHRTFSFEVIEQSGTSEGA